MSLSYLSRRDQHLLWDCYISSTPFKCTVWVSFSLYFHPSGSELIRVLLLRNIFIHRIVFCFGILFRIDHIAEPRPFCSQTAVPKVRRGFQILQSWCFHRRPYADSRPQKCWVFLSLFFSHADEWNQFARKNTTCFAVNAALQTCVRRIPLLSFLHTGALLS